MSINGTAQTEYASLSGKIHTFVVDKTLSISGACADAKATGEAIDSAVGAVHEDAAEYATEKALEAVGELADEVARTAAVEAVADEVDKAIKDLHYLTEQDVNTICNGGSLAEDDKLLNEVGLTELWSIVNSADVANTNLANAKAKIATGTYTGTGTYGYDGKNTLTFDFVPEFIAISCELAAGAYIQAAFFVPRVGGFSGNGNVGDQASVAVLISELSGTTASWYSRKSSGYQCNAENYVYHYIAIG